MEGIGFSWYEADVWLRPSLKYDRVEHYQHALLYTDYILDIMEEPVTFLRE